LFLSKRNGTYYLRVRIPLDVRRFFPSPELKRSLGTGNHSQAKSLAVVMVGRLQEVVTMAKDSSNNNLNN